MKYAKTLVVTVNPTLCKLAVKKNNSISFVLDQYAELDCM